MAPGGAQITHEWLAAGTEPATDPPVVSLMVSRHSRAARALHRLRTETPTDEFAMLMASPAWRIPAGSERYCYRLTLTVATQDRPVGPDTDLDALAALETTDALAALKTPEVIGDHPGTRPVPLTYDICQARPSWCSRPASTRPDQTDKRVIPLNSARVQDYQSALDLYLDMALDLGEPEWDDQTGPEITIWRCLIGELRTNLIDEDAHLDPTELTAALAQEIKQKHG